MIIEIGYDRDLITAAHLKAWEDGTRGEIFS